MKDVLFRESYFEPIAMIHRVQELSERARDCNPLLRIPFEFIQPAF